MAKLWGRVTLLASLFIIGLVVAAYGRPAATEASSHGGSATIPLRVTTSTYTLSAAGLTVPGYAQLDQPGAPALPVWQSVVEVPTDGEWEISATVLKSERLIAPATLPSVPVPVIPAPAEALDESLTEIPVIARPDPAIYGADALYPATLAEVGSVQQQGERRYLPVRVFPFQYNPVTNELRFASDIALTVTMRPGSARQSVLPTFQVNEAAQANSMAGALRITVGERGIYRLTYADLIASGVSAADLLPSGLAMSSQGQPVAIEIIGGEDNRFDPGDSILFYADSIRTRWTKHNVFWLSYGGATGPRIASRAASSTGSPSNEMKRSVHLEEQQLYLSRAERPSDQDHGFYSQLTPSRAGSPTVSQDYPITLPAPLATGTATLEILLHGTSLSAYSPDKSIEVKLNGQSLGLYQWANMGDHSITVSFNNELLSPSGLNTITLVASLDALPGAPGLTYFTVAPDWFRVTYPSTTLAQNDRLHLTGPLGSQTQRIVSGLSGTPGPLSRVYDIRTPTNPVRLSNVQRQPGTILFSDQAAATPPPYFVSSEAGLLSPLSIVRDTPSTLQNSANEADYIAIYHASLRDSITPLLDHRQAEGLRVARIDVQDIYDEFNYGLPDQEAIRDFLIYAYHNWNGGGPRPTYVLLVGDSTEDFLGELPNVNPAMNLLPTYFLDIDPYQGESSADNRFVSVNGPDDYLPDMHLGRLPAWSPISLTNYVNKVLTYEGQSSPAPWQKRVAYVADNDEDPSYNFALLQDEIRNHWLPAAYSSTPIYFDPNGSIGGMQTPAAMKTAIRAAYNDGSLVVQWFGHGSVQRWGSVTGMFNMADPLALNANSSWPLTVHLSCLNSVYLYSKPHGNNFPALSESLTMLAPNRGSIGDIGPTGYHVGSAMTPLAQGIHHSLFQARQNRLGAVADEAKLFYFQNSWAWHDVIDTTLVTGDPAVALRLPDTPSLTASTLSAAPNPVYPGQDVTYSLHVVNSGSSPATNVVAVLDYDQSLGTPLLGHGGTDNGDKITWNEGTMGAGVATTHHVVFRVADSAPPGAGLPASATISSTEMRPVALSAPVTIGTGAAPTVTPITTPTRTPTITPTRTPSAGGRSLFLPLVIK